MLRRRRSGRLPVAVPQQSAGSLTAHDLAARLRPEAQSAGDKPPPGPNSIVVESAGASTSHCASRNALHVERNLFLSELLCEDSILGQEVTDSVLPSATNPARQDK